MGIQISEDRTDAFQTKASSIFEDMKHFYSKHEKNMKMTINKSRDVPHKPLDINDSDKIINFICTVSSGMSIYDWDMSVVESSSNIGLISLKNNVLECTQSIRSNNLYGETQLLLKSFALIKLLNGKYEIHNSAKAWSPDKNNRLAKYIIDVAKDKMNETFKLVCKHAGKEVAHVLDAYPNATGVSIGFNIFEAHTPNESVEIKTIDRMYTLLQHLLISIKE